MCSGIVDNKIVADIHFWQHAVYGKFIVIFTKRTGHVIFAVARSVFFSEDGDMMVRAVHGRPH